MKIQVLAVVLSISIFASTVRAQERNRTKGITPLAETPASVTIAAQTMYKVERRNLNYFATPLVKLSNIKTRVIDDAKVDPKSIFPSGFEPQVFISMEKKQAFASILVPQYIQRADKRIEQLIDYTLDITENPPAQKTSGSRVYAANSVLASGTFYKISIPARGLYKIDFNFLTTTLGLNPNLFSAHDIRLYGNGGEMLDENNAVFRHDDLVENAILVEDGGDGQMNPGDYILFYANGPHSIIKDSLHKKFTHVYNIYAEESTYFLNVDIGPGKRIGMQSQSPTPNVSVNSFNEFLFYEKDSVNLGRFGKTWWGDEFSDQPGRYLNRTFRFSIPNMDQTQPVNIVTRTGAISYSGNNTFSMNVSGVALPSAVLAPTGPNYYDPVIVSKLQSDSIVLPSGEITYNFNFSKGSNTAVGYLDYIEVNARRNLVFNGYLNIADWRSVGAGNVAGYSIQNANANTQVWDITDPLIPVKMITTLNGSTLSFSQDASTLHRFLALDGSSVGSPSFVEKIANQNLHGLAKKDYIIIVNPALRAQAEKLAAYHSTKRGYSTLIVTPGEIYNEFSSGTQDVAAIRDFIKMFYDRAAVNDLPKYVLLFGDASYDYKNRLSGNTNLVPVSETPESINKTTGYCTDDFFGFLDDQENLNNYSNNQINTLDIGIGRFPVSTIANAENIINKIIQYDSPKSFGPWKNNMTFNADNGDANGHIDDAEAVTNYTNDSLPVYNKYKIYVGGFNIESTPAGPRAPDANKAVTQQIYNGTFLMNYNGHGGPLGWSEERIFSMDDVNAMTNINRLPLFLTATCDFAPFDNPAVNSAGEILLTKPDGGAIALMTTTQLVYADQNRIMNLNYMKSGFSPMDNNQAPTMGDAYRLSKNLRYVSSVSEFVASNFRKFALLGDPGLPLAFPVHRVKTDSINGISVTVAYDTLKALGKYTISGHVEDINGNALPNFNGVVYPTIFDKPKKLSTIDPATSKYDYFVQNNILYKGKATVKNGKFSFTFVVPKDINYEIAKGKISYYADNAAEDGNGYDNKIFIGGSSNNPITDNQGPVIKAYLNNEKFVNGGLTTKNSILLLKLSDDNGINYTGNSVGHDITAILDDNAQNTYVLNNFFEAELDDYRAGTVKFPLTNLAEGKHTLTIKAWDIMNNSSEVKLDFVVASATEGVLANVYNYPNPFSTHTQFMFEHNMPNQNLYVSIKVLSMSGKVVKNIHTLVNTEGTRVSNIDWDGLDEYGERLGNGVYLYNLSVKSQNGFSDSKLQKLILLR